MGVGKSTFAFSTSSITIDGGSTTIDITRDNQSYSHKLLHGYGDIATLAVGTTSYTYSPTASDLTEFFQEIPAQKSRLIDIYLDTYNGSTKVGRDVHALTVTLSEDTGKPYVFAPMSVSDGKLNDTFVRGLSSIEMSDTVVVAPFYGAKISSTSFVDGDTGLEYSTLNDLISSVSLRTDQIENHRLGYKVTDSRGFSTTFWTSVPMVEYTRPNFKYFEIYRCDTSGNESENGTKAKIKALVLGNYTVTPNGATTNTLTLKIGYKKADASSYTYETIFSNKKFGTSTSETDRTISQVLDTTFDTNADYEFDVQLIDDIATYNNHYDGFLNDSNVLYVSADGKEVVIGSNAANNVLIDSDSVDIRTGSTVNATFGSDLIELGKNSKDSVIKMCGGKGSITVVDTDDGEILTLESNRLRSYGSSVEMFSKPLYNSEGDTLDADDVRAQGGLYVTTSQNDTLQQSFSCLEMSLDAWSADDTKQSQAYISASADPNSGSSIDFSVSDESDDNVIRFTSPNTVAFTSAKTGREVRVGVGAGGVNRGLWDSENNLWMIHREDDGKRTYINGLSYNFKITSHTVVSSKSMSSVSYVDGTTNISSSGWRPFAIAGFTTNTRYAHCNRAFLSAINEGSGTITWMVTNWHSNSHTVTCDIRVLWIQQ